MELVREELLVPLTEVHSYFLMGFICLFILKTDRLGNERYFKN